MKKCHSCRRELLMTTKPGRRDKCPFCDMDLHCCLNCTFYEGTAPKQCREPIAEFVKQKDKANYCEFFAFGRDISGGQAEAAEKSRKELDDLFKR